MNSTLITGSFIITLTLILYSIAIINEQRTKRITKGILFFLTLGVLSNITATIFMKVSNYNANYTMHDLLGYIALLAMFIYAVRIWIFKLRNGDLLIPNILHKFAKYVYLGWVAVYISGGVLAMI